MLFPYTIWRDNLVGANASNNVFRIKMTRGLKHPMAVWAQEYYESRLKRNLLASLRIRLNPQRRRRMEIISHEIEVQAAHWFYNEDKKIHRLYEAKAMKLGYGGLFSGFSVEQIQSAMETYEDVANSFVQTFHNEIMKYGKEPTK